uniref:Uncharacterized protein n=1 Tax=Salix viminalis TaxID=40686 RepID=A0A6N2MB99_SALVM
MVRNQREFGGREEDKVLETEGAATATGWTGDGNMLSWEYSTAN